MGRLVLQRSTNGCLSLSSAIESKLSLEKAAIGQKQTSEMQSAHTSRRSQPR